MTTPTISSDNLPPADSLAFLLGLEDQGEEHYRDARMSFDAAANLIIALANAGVLTKTFATLAAAEAGDIPAGVEVALILRSTGGETYAPRFYSRVEPDASIEPSSDLKFENDGEWWVSRSGAGGGYDPATDQYLSVDTTLTASDVRRGFVGIGSANRTIVLPDLDDVQLGDWIVFSVAHGSAGIFTLSCADLIDGLTARDMWDGESVLLVATANGWTKRGGVSIPYAGWLTRTTDFTITPSSNNVVPFDSAASDFTFHHHFFNSGTGAAKAPRRSQYRVECFGNIVATGGGFAVGYVKTGATVWVRSQDRQDKAGGAYVRPSIQLTLAKDETINFVVNTDGTSPRVEADSDIALYITEVVSW